VPGRHLVFIVSVGFKIGERLPEQAPKGPGPGAYEVEKADVATKCRSAQINMSSGKQRPDNFTKL
jgi:hypothetical protein